MVEEVFVDAATPEGPGYTPHGERHVELVGRYRDLLTRLATALGAECLELDPAGRAYSPLGISYGFCADVLWNVALGALTARSSSTLSLEDLFESRTRLDDKAARAQAWEDLPTRAGEHEHFTHAPEWAQQVFADVVDRLRQLGAGDAGARTGRLLVRPHTIEPGPAIDARLCRQCAGARRHIRRSMGIGDRGNGLPQEPSPRRSPGRAIPCERRAGWQVVRGVEGGADSLPRPRQRCRDRRCAGLPRGRFYGSRARVS